jgi:tetratricopeptide (TPR) repeat protein
MCVAECGLAARGIEAMKILCSSPHPAGHAQQLAQTNSIVHVGSPRLAASWVALMTLIAVPAMAQTATPAGPAQPAAASTKPAAKPKAQPVAKASPAKPSAEGEQSADAKKDPNEAQKHVDNGIRLLQGGKVDAAVHTFSSVIGAGKLPAPIMARALYNRGLAYRKQGKPAQAISDLTSALWLKGGLNEAERADALASRVAAYRDAGSIDWRRCHCGGGQQSVGNPVENSRPSDERSDDPIGAQLGTAICCTCAGSNSRARRAQQPIRQFVRRYDAIGI